MSGAEGREEFERFTRWWSTDHNYGDPCYEDVALRAWQASRSQALEDAVAHIRQEFPMPECRPIADAVEALKKEG